MNRVVIFLLLSSSGCRLAPPTTLKSMPPMTWVLAERPYDEISATRLAGEARIAPTAIALVLGPVANPQGCDHSLQTLGAEYVSLEVGQTATIEFALQGGRRCDHVMTVEPTRSGIELLTPAIVTVPHAERCVVRFQGLTAGRGGVRVRILNCRVVN